MTKKFVAVLEISENDPYINDLGDLKEEIEKLLYLPGGVVSIKPLQKGHGDLIDRNFVRDAFIYAEMRKDYEYLGLDEAPAIIEADKGETK